MSPSRSRRRPPDAVHHPLFARWYARMSVAAEPTMGAHRRELLTGLSGRVVEVGAGNGLNFGYYPRTVSSVVAVEPERALRESAADAAQDERTPVPVEVVPGTGEALPLESGSCDAAVACLVLCSVRDAGRALGEIHRVLRPGGELRFFEHGLAWTGGRAARVQRVLDATVWPRLFGGCHVARDTVAAIEAAGFRIGPSRRLLVPGSRPRLPSAYCTLGRAERLGRT